MSECYSFPYCPDDLTAHCHWAQPCFSVQTPPSTSQIPPTIFGSSTGSHLHETLYLSSPKNTWLPTIQGILWPD